MEIDGDEFAESDYGLLVDNSQGTQELSQKLDMLAQAALQNQKLSFSTIMKLYSSVSLIEKQRLVEQDEQELQERAEQAQQQQLQSQQQIAQMTAQQKEKELALQEEANIRDNETKIVVANINAQSKINDGIKQPECSEEKKAELWEKIREFDKRLELDRERLNFDKEKAKTDARLKEKQINKPIKTSK